MNHKPHTSMSEQFAIAIKQKIKYTVKPVYNSHSLKDQKLVFKTSYCLMQVKTIAECSKECSKGRILQYF